MDRTFHPEQIDVKAKPISTTSNHPNAMCVASSFHKTVVIQLLLASCIDERYDNFKRVLNPNKNPKRESNVGAFRIQWKFCSEYFRFFTGVNLDVRNNPFMECMEV